MRRGVLVGCLVAAGCLVPNPEPRTPCYAAVLGTLWPPDGDPMFAVAARHVTLARGGQVVAETDTDRRGRFELRAEEDGVYTVAFSTKTHGAAADVKLGGCFASERLDLFVRPR